MIPFRKHHALKTLARANALLRDRQELSGYDAARHVDRVLGIVPTPTLRCLSCGMPYIPGDHHRCTQ